MSYIVTARKWRPMVFEDVAGQAHVSTTLRNAIATNRLSHAYIFSGPRGVGKTTTARILAKAINCLNPTESNPDNTCELCVEITENRSLNVFEIDGASNRGVDEIRNLRESVRYAPAKGRYKVYIIDEVHMLTKEAFNALLKTLEEPPSHVLFIFATTEIQKVPLTILSRCQRFEFRRIATAQIIDRLRFIAVQEQITIGDDALFLIAKKGDGSLRDAQSVFDQIISFCGQAVTLQQIREMLNIVDEELYFRLDEAIRSKDTKSGLALVDEIVKQGVDIREFLVGFNEHLRNLLIVRATGSAELIETSEIYKQHYAEHAQLFSESDLLRLIGISGETETAIRWSRQPRFRLEIGILYMLKMDSSVNIHELLGQVEELKKKLDSGATWNSTLSVPPIGEKTATNTTQEKRKEMSAVQNIAQQNIETTTPLQYTVRESSVTAPAVAFSTPTPVSNSIEKESAATLTFDASLGKWPSLIEEACKHRIALGTMLRETTLVGVQDNRLHIGCPDDFHFDALKRNREFLTELARKVYGAKIQLETILSNGPGPTLKVDSEDPAQQRNKKNKKEESGQHPVIKALVREFDARKIE